MGRRSIGEEIGKREPFDLPEEEAYLNVWRTGAVLDHAVNRLLRPQGLTKVSYNILRILRAAGDAGRTGAEISSMVVADVPDMARLIGRLERLGFLVRERSAEDRRVVRNFVTRDGAAAVEAVTAGLRELHREQFSALTEPELATLIELLTRVRGCTIRE